MTDWVRIEAGHVSVALDPSIGNIRAFTVNGRDIFHSAHWVGTTAAQAAQTPVDAQLSGDFFCAPFGGSGVAKLPPHGWTANAQWSPMLRAENADMAVMKLALDRDVFGARVTKEIRIIAAHPVLYQTHVISGGQGDLTFAHHPMLHLAKGGHIGLSPKSAAITPNAPLEPAHRFAYPARSQDLGAFPAADGGTVDLHQYPSEARHEDGAGHEDFVTCVEAKGRDLGWTAVTRYGENDIVLFLKDPRVMPVTMMWQSNGGREYAPWNGRHTGVLGIEDGCAAGAASVSEAAGETPISREGARCTLTLGAHVTTQVRHATVVVSRPADWDGVADVCLAGEGLRVTSLSGAHLEIAFDLEFFDL